MTYQIIHDLAPDYPQNFILCHSLLNEPDPATWASIIFLKHAKFFFGSLCLLLFSPRMFFLHLIWVPPSCHSYLTLNVPSTESKLLWPTTSNRHPLFLYLIVLFSILHNTSHYRHHLVCPSSPTKPLESMIQKKKDLVNPVFHYFLSTYTSA